MAGAPVDVGDAGRDLRGPIAACCTFWAISWVAAPCSSMATAIAARKSHEMPTCIVIV